MRKKSIEKKIIKLNFSNIKHPTFELTLYQTSSKKEQNKFLSDFIKNLIISTKIPKDKYNIFEASTNKLLKIDNISNVIDEISIEFLQEVNFDNFFGFSNANSFYDMQTEAIHREESEEGSILQLRNSPDTKIKIDKEKISKILMDEETKILFQKNLSDEFNKEISNKEIQIEIEKISNRSEKQKKNLEKNSPIYEKIENPLEKENSLESPKEDVDSNRIENFRINENIENENKDSEILLNKKKSLKLYNEIDLQEEIPIKKLSKNHIFFISGKYQTAEVDSSIPNALPKTMTTGYFSFLPKNPEKFTTPAPAYLKFELISKKKGTSKKEIFTGNDITDGGELKLVDREVLDKQKGIVSEMIKKISKSIAEGRGIVGVSMPVRIFEPRSSVERIVDWWAYTPVYLPPAAASSDPVFRFKNVIAFAFAGLSVSVCQLKPFNPLLGETFQAVFPDGTEICCEHSSHHPPITNFLLVGKGFRYYGRYEYVAKPNATFNVINFRQEGLNTVEFEDGQKVQYMLPEVKMCGMIIGDRVIKYHGVMKFEDIKNSLKAVIKIGAVQKKGMFKKKRSDLIEGKIYYKKKGVVDKICKKRKDQDKEDLKLADVDTVIEEITGSWIDNLFFGNQEFWNFNRIEPVRHTPVENPLPTDARFREDLVWLKYNNLSYSEAWKLKLEERQRFERKLRIDYAKKNK